MTQTQKYILTIGLVLMMTALIVSIRVMSIEPSPNTTIEATPTTTTPAVIAAPTLAPHVTSANTVIDIKQGEHLAHEAEQQHVKLEQDKQQRYEDAMKQSIEHMKTSAGAH